MRVPIARRNLFESPTRMLIGVGGVALAMVLVLALDGVFAGALKGVTAYIDTTKFDIVVAQEGVRNLHMTSSQFSESNIDRIRNVTGVSEADPILFTSAFLIAGDRRSLVYLIGYQEGRLGGPPSTSLAPSRLEEDDIVIDERVASEMGLAIGDEVTVLGRDFRVAGFVTGTLSVTNSVAYIRFEDFEAATRMRNTASFGLVEVRPGTDPESTASRIRARADDLTVQTKQQFARSERKVVSDMSTDILRIMNLIGFLIGLAVVGLTVYTATLGKLREYGVLKAIGAPATRLLRTVFAQALMSVALGFVFAVGITVAIAGVLSLLNSNIRIVVETTSIWRVAAGAVTVALLASALPILRVARIEPADVFRR